MTCASHCLPQRHHGVRDEGTHTYTHTHAQVATHLLMHVDRDRGQGSNRGPGARRTRRGVRTCEGYMVEDEVVCACVCVCVCRYVPGRITPGSTHGHDTLYHCE